MLQDEVAASEQADEGTAEGALEPPRVGSRLPAPEEELAEAGESDEEFPVREGTGRGWGDLPPRLRTKFLADGERAFPPRYRSWIDDYYERLSKLPE